MPLIFLGVPSPGGALLSIDPQAVQVARAAWGFYFDKRVKRIPADVSFDASLGLQFLTHSCPVLETEALQPPLYLFFKSGLEEQFNRPPIF